MSSRAQILGRVRAAIAAGGAAPPAPIPREYRADGPGGIELFLDRVAHYDAEAEVVAAGELARAVRARLTARAARRVVVPDGIPEEWVDGLEPLRDSPPLTAHQLDGADGVLTTCALAIAETGTLVLDGSAGMGRRALTLVPDYHLCVVRAEQVVPTIPQALAAVEPTRPLTFISGPSATVDIEMVRVRGVHGPRTLDLLIVG